MKIIMTLSVRSAKSGQNACLFYAISRFACLHHTGKPSILANNGSICVLQDEVERRNDPTRGILKNGRARGAIHFVDGKPLMFAPSVPPEVASKVKRGLVDFDLAMPVGENEPIGLSGQVQADRDGERG